MSEPLNDNQPRIWVLLGSRVGDNNQLLALAEALGLPFETRTLGYRRRWIRWLRLFPTLPFLLDRRSRRRTLGPPWPDVVIGIGRRSVAIARWIRRKTRGKAKIVRLGNPRADPRLFDLVLTTPQYPVPPGDNVVVLPLSMGRHRAVAAQPDEERWLKALPRPHLLLSLGGVTRYWTLANGVIADCATRLAERAAAAGGTLIVVGSPRTAPETLASVKAAVAGRSNVALDPPVRFPVLLADADEHFVTADSVSMISEAAMTGKPVGLVPVELDEEGREELGLEQDYSSDFRDLRRFWAALEQRSLAGTVDEPRGGAVDDPVEMAVVAVRRLLGNRVE